MKNLILTALLFLTSTAEASMFDYVKRYQISYSIQDDGRIRFFGELRCASLGDKDEYYNIGVNECSTDGVCSTDLWLNSKMKYRCSLKTDEKTYFLGVVTLSPFKINKKNQAEEVVPFTVEPR